MEKSSVIEPMNNVKGITMNLEDKLTTIEFGLFVGEDIKILPLQISEVENHNCEFDEEKNISRRRFNDGTTQDVPNDQMKETRNTRKAQGRQITEIKENKGPDLEI